MTSKEIIKRIVAHDAPPRFGFDFYTQSDFYYVSSRRDINLPDNPYDAEAIKVMMKGVGLVGYVANSVYTVKGESRSAGRIYDHIGKKAKGTVKVVLQDGVICKLDQKK